MGSIYERPTLNLRLKQSASEIFHLHSEYSINLPFFLLDLRPQGVGRGGAINLAIIMFCCVSNWDLLANLKVKLIKLLLNLSKKLCTHRREMGVHIDRNKFRCVDRLIYGEVAAPNKLRDNFHFHQVCVKNTRSIWICVFFFINCISKYCLQGRRE